MGHDERPNRTELVGGLLLRITCELRVLEIDPPRHAAELRCRLAVVFSNPDSRIFMPKVAEDIGFSLRPTACGETARWIVVARPIWPSDLPTIFGLPHAANKLCFSPMVGCWRSVNRTR